MKFDGAARWMMPFFGIIFLLIVYVSFLTSYQPTTTESNVANQAPSDVPSPNDAVQATRKHLTKEQLIEELKSKGLNPDDYDLDAYQPPETVPSDKQQVHSNVHYVITVTDGSGHQESYLSEKEPKPYGNGYKFKMAGTEIEITVSGNVQIMRFK